MFKKTAFVYVFLGLLSFSWANNHLDREYSSMFSQESLDKFEDNMLRSLYSWPIERTVQDKLIPYNSINEKIRGSIESWNKIVFKATWLPTAKAEIVGIKSEIDGYDTVRFRYSVKNYNLHITHRSNGMWVVIKPIEGKISESIEEMKLRVQSLINDVFQESEKLHKTISNNLNKSGIGYESKPISIDPLWWWGQVWAHSDGNAVGFSILKAASGAGEPLDIRNWLVGSDKSQQQK